MARQQKLKVFKTAIGFHDAYVAAPSKKAALAAWGSDADLFARGMAELVTDEQLSCEPLAHPGKVIKRLRGTVEEQLAALPPEPSVAGPGRTSGSQTTTRPAKSRSAGAENRPAAKPKPKPRPRPSRAQLDAAEADMAELLVHQEAELSELRLCQQALDRERARIEQAHERARRNAERALARERKLHAEKLERWSNGQGQA